MVIVNIPQILLIIKKLKDIHLLPDKKKKKKEKLIKIDIIKMIIFLENIYKL